MGGLRKYMPITFWTFMIGIARARGHLPVRRASGRRTRSSSPRARAGYDVFLVVGLVGAFLTAAYMTRCVYLTFFGEYRGHGHPHESRAAHHGAAHRPRGASRSSPASLNAAPFGIEKFKEWVEPTRRRSPSSCTPTSTTRRRPSRSSIAVLGIGIAAFFWFQREELGALKGLTERNKLAHAGLHVPREQVLPRRTSTRTSSSPAIKGADRPRPRTGSTST